MRHAGTRTMGEDIAGASGYGFLQEAGDAAMTCNVNSDSLCIAGRHRASPDKASFWAADFASVFYHRDPFFMHQEEDA
jgi:hypothetical protein